MIGLGNDEKIFDCAGGRTGAGEDQALLPCPLDQVLRETREHNKKLGRTPPETLYQGLAQ